MRNTSIAHSKVRVSKNSKYVWVKVNGKKTKIRLSLISDKIRNQQSRVRDRDRDFGPSRTGPRDQPTYPHQHPDTALKHQNSPWLGATMSDHSAGDRVLSAEEWAWACERLPITCVDVLPVQLDGDGDVHRVGLILRDSPFGHQVWCHIGGRVLLGETLAEAAARHLHSSLKSDAKAQMGQEAYYVNEFLPAARPGFGHDPRKHAVAACFLAELPAGHVPEVLTGEALEFRWFTRDSLPGEPDLWPGTRSMVEHPGAQGAGRHVTLTYEALNARYISHNELMWQTPALAMTAMAFLLTIALGGSEDWMRALAAGLSAVIALISAQLMAKHSSNQLRDAEALYQLEIRLGMIPVHRRPDGTDPPVGSTRLQRWFSSKRSRDWWFRALLLFAAVSTLVCALATAAALATL